MKCAVCSSSSTVLWSERSWFLPGYARNFHYRVCLSCESIYCDPLPSSDEIASYYADHFDYGWFEEHLALKKFQAACRWKSVVTLLKKHHMDRGRVLDVGCGHGLFLSCAQRSGWEAVGVDYPSIATTYARQQLGLDVVEGDLCSVVAGARIGAGSFNLVVSWHCLEHVMDPMSFLRGMSAALAPGGKLLVAVPNVNSQGMRLCRENWVWCQQPYVHLTHFSDKALMLLARDCGLKVLDIWTHDTWDANPAFDIHAAPIITHLAKIIRPISVTAAFLAEEVGRVACYTANRIGHQFFHNGKGAPHGSELLFLAERCSE